MAHPTFAFQKRDAASVATVTYVILSTVYTEVSMLTHVQYVGKTVNPLKNFF